MNKSFDYSVVQGDGIPSNSGKTHVYNTVSEAKLLKDAGVEIYGVGISLQNNVKARYTMHNVVTLTGTPGNLSYAEHYIDCDDSTGQDLATTLNKAFSVIEKNITVKTNAWKVNDVMGNMVSFAGFVIGRDGGAAASADGRTLDWNLKALAASPEKKDGKYVYQIQYYVTLNGNYENQTPHVTNEKATLTYSFEDDVYTEDTTDPDGTTHIKGEQRLYTRDFVQPQVQGFRAEFSFRKQNVEGTALRGAEFKLYPSGSFTSAKNPGTAVATAFSTAGNVHFEKIAFGTYVLMETATSDAAYDLAEAQTHLWTVTVAYGVATVRDENGKVMDSDAVFRNVKSQVPISITVEKQWVDGNNAENTRPGEITFTLVQTVGDKRTDYGTYTLTAGENWKTTISNLPSIDLATNQSITYSVKEQKVEGYTTTYGDDQNGTLVICNVIEKIDTKMDVTLTKTWMGPEPGDGKVTVTLTRTSAKPGGTAETVGSYTFKGEHTVKDLPRYDAEGYLYTYTATETAVEGYHVQMQAGNPFAFTNVVDQTTKTISGTKTWKIAGWTGDALTATFTLTAENYDGFQPRTATVTSGSQTSTYAFNDLPVYVYTLADGTQVTEIPNGAVVTAAEEIQYQVKETGTGGDKIVSSQDGGNFTNTLQDTQNLTVTKVWVDEDNKNDTRPDSVTLILSGNGQEYTHTFKAAVYETAKDGEDAAPTRETSWNGVDLSYTFTDLPVYDASGAKITYTVSEQGADNNTIAGKDGTSYAVEYNQETYTVTNTLNGGSVTISGTKTWVDGGNAGGTRPDSIQVGLFKDGASEPVQEVTVQADADGKWTYTFAAAALYENGRKISYTVKELGVPEGYEVSYSGDNNREITNTLHNEDTSITAAKAWVDGDNANNTRPGSVTLVLRANGKEVKEAQATADNGWKVTFSGLPKYDDGRNVITYTVSEKQVDSAYDQTGLGDASNNYTVTNTLKKGTTSVSVQKNWIGGGDHSKSVIWVRLLRDGKNYEAPLPITGNGTATFSDLPKYDDNYHAYQYTVEETSVPDGYTASVTQNGENNFLITNRKNIEKMTISVEKTFVGPEAEGSIFAGLFRKNGDGVTKVETQELNKANGWKATFTQDATDGNYSPLNYEVRELTSADDETGLLAGQKNGNYTVSYSGSNNRVITNTIDQVEKSLTVEKKWANMDASGVNVKPEAKEVTVQLGYLAAGQFVAYGNPVKLNADNDWTYTFEKLPTYALADAKLTLTDGSAVQYAIREVASDGSFVADKGTISLGEGNAFQVNYSTADNGNLVVTNTFDAPNKYYYRVERHYSATVNGNTTTESVWGELVTVQPDGNRQITIGGDSSAVVNYNDYLTQGRYTYQFDHADPASVQVLELPNHEYVIKLYYVYTRSGGNGGGGGDRDTSLTVKKVWSGDNADIRPDSVEVQLLRDGVAYGKPRTLNEKNNWRTSWTSLDSVYDWSVEEVDVPDGYTASVSHKGTAWTITNVLDGTEIPDEPTPEGDKPGDSGDSGKPENPARPGEDSDLDIPDEDVPLADLPRTGDTSGLWLAVAAASAAGLAAVNLLGRKRREENN